MKIYESLKDVLDESQLQSFKDEVEMAIQESAEIKSKELIQASKEEADLAVEAVTAKADEFVEMKIASETALIEEKAEEYVALKITEATAELETDFDNKLESLEETVVSSLDSFLENEIAERISDSLLDTIAEQQALLPLVNGIKSLFEDKFVALDTEGSSMVKELQAENAKLSESVEQGLQEKIELSQLAESAATKLLVAEKCESLTVSEADRVKTFFEGKDFSEVSTKIDKYVTIVEGEKLTPESNATMMTEAASASPEFKETPAVHKQPEDSVIGLAAKFM
jgi:transcriptional antiterminator Rof (Rho-off)